MCVFFLISHRGFVFCHSRTETRDQSKSANMPISDFRKKKLLYVFNVFFGKLRMSRAQKPMCCVCSGNSRLLCLEALAVMIQFNVHVIFSSVRLGCLQHVWIIDAGYEIDISSVMKDATANFFKALSSGNCRVWILFKIFFSPSGQLIEIRRSIMNITDKPKKCRTIRAVSVNWRERARARLFWY